MIVETVIQLLLADPAVSAIVDERIHPRFAPDAATFPLLIVTKASGVGEYTNDGDAGLEFSRVQIDCYSDRGASKVIELRNAVRRLLSGFKGGAVSGSPCAIASCFVITDMDLSEPSTERTGPRLKRRMLEFNIWNREL